MRVGQVVIFNKYVVEEIFPTASGLVRYRLGKREVGKDIVGRVIQKKSYSVRNEVIGCKEVKIKEILLKEVDIFLVECYDVGENIVPIQFYPIPIKKNILFVLEEDMEKFLFQDSFVVDIKLS